MEAIQIRRDNLAECYKFLEIPRENIKTVKKNGGITVFMNSGEYCLIKFGEWLVRTGFSELTRYSNDEYIKMIKGTKVKILEIWYLLWAILLKRFDNHYYDNSYFDEFTYYWYYKLVYKMNNFHITTKYVKELDKYIYTYNPNKFTEEPIRVKDWEELKKLNLENNDVRVDVEEYNGWITDKKNGKGLFYLSTHTFYESNYSERSKLLGCYGFNVQLENWG